MHRLHHLHRRPDRSPGSSAAPQRRLLSVLLIAQLMVILDIRPVNVALPDVARGVRGRRLRDRLDNNHQQLSALRQPAPARRARRRLAQSPARLLRRLSVFTAASLASALAVSSTALFAARARQGSALRCCRQHRPRSSRRASGHGAGASARRLGRSRRRRRRRRRPARRRPHPGCRLARDLLHQPAGRCWRRADRAKRRACRSVRTPRGTVQLLLGRTARRLNLARETTGLDEVQAWWGPELAATAVGAKR